MLMRIKMEEHKMELKVSERKAKKEIEL